MSVWDSINAFLANAGAFFKPNPNPDPKTKKVALQAILEYRVGKEPISGQPEEFAYSLTGQNKWVNISMVDTGSGGVAPESVTLTIGKTYDFRAIFNGSLSSGLKPSIDIQRKVLIT